MTGIIYRTKLSHKYIYNALKAKANLFLNGHTEICLIIMTHTLYRNFWGRWFGKVIRIEVSESGLTLIDLGKGTKSIL